MRRAYHFPGFTVLVPGQIRREVEVVPKILPQGIPEGIPEITENFTLIRAIANLALFRSDDLENGNFDDPVQQFDPPIELRINYRMADMGHTNGDFNRLKLAYWDLEKWVVISDESHEYHIFPPSTGQIAEAKIGSWADDPTIAWGR